MRTRHVVLAFGLLAAAAAWRLSFAGDPADDAFDSPEVKELGVRAHALKLDDEIALMKRIQRSLDEKLLVPNEDAWRGFESFRGRADAGVARILHRGVCAGLVTPRESGAYWSFTKRSNSYDHEPELALEQNMFSTGFAGADTGAVMRLDATSLTSISEANVPDDLRVSATEYYAASRGPRPASVGGGAGGAGGRAGGGAGGAGGGVRARDRVPAETGGVYVVRAILWDKSDVLAAFQVVAIDNYGATIAWKILKLYDTPTRPR